MKTKLLTAGLISFIILFVTHHNAFSQQTMQVSNAERFIAYSLYNFSKLIDWPNSGMLSVFQIAVVGDKKVYVELLELSKNKKVGNATYQIDYFKSTEEMAGNYQMVYLSNLQSSKVQSLSSNPKMKNVLLVTEREGMASSGSTISFLINENGQMGFEIAKMNAQKNQLTIRSQLERMAMKII